jgi:hypothetical protein
MLIGKSYMFSRMSCTLNCHRLLSLCTVVVHLKSAKLYKLMYSTLLTEFFFLSRAGCTWYLCGKGRNDGEMTTHVVGSNSGAIVQSFMKNNMLLWDRAMRRWHHADVRCIHALVVPMFSCSVEVAYDLETQPVFHLRTQAISLCTSLW